MTETRYLKLNYGEAIPSKKQILTTEIDFINLHNHLNNYRLLRKKELETKSKIKTLFSQIRSKVNQIQSDFPEEKLKIEKLKHEKIIQNTEPKPKKPVNDYQKEIEAKLAKLG